MSKDLPFGETMAVWCDDDEQKYLRGAKKPRSQIKGFITFSCGFIACLVFIAGLLFLSIIVG